MGIWVDPNITKKICVKQRNTWGLVRPLRPHPCSITGTYICEGIDCGDNSKDERYLGINSPFFSERSGGDLVGEDVNDEIFGCPQFEKSLSFGDYVDQNFRAVCAVFFHWSRIGWMFM